MAEQCSPRRGLGNAWYVLPQLWERVEVQMVGDNSVVPTVTRCFYRAHSEAVYAIEYTHWVIRLYDIVNLSKHVYAMATAPKVVIDLLIIRPRVTYFSFAARYDGFFIHAIRPLCIVSAFGQLITIS